MRLVACLMAAATAVMVWVLPAAGPAGDGRAAWAQDLPPGLAGSWDGWGRQDTGSRWSIAVTLTPSGGKIAYPSLDCGGVLKPLPGNKAAARFGERLTYGLERCIDGGVVGLSLTDRRQLAYRWWYPDGSDGAAGLLEPRQ